MAGLAAAAHARSLGADVVVMEKGSRAGGSMLLSSGMAWRHRTFELFREECPAGDPELQRLLDEVRDRRLDPLTAVQAIMHKVFRLDDGDQDGTDPR